MLGYQSLVAVVASVSVAQAGLSQFPVVDGVIGGIPNVSVTESSSDLETTSIAGVQASAVEGGLRYVENSGVCETADGVYQASGYGDIAANSSIWFWFFESRNNKDDAPLTLWFNGGPGSSSMVGLFQENGPCRINNESTDVFLNKYSWNNNSHIMFIDQPIGVGFSTGPTQVGTSFEAAADVWKFMQIFFKNETFAYLQEKPLAIWTESYGGHYGPTFAAYFLQQNAKIDAGEIEGLKLNLQVLGVGDGMTDPLNQYEYYSVYAKENPYHQLVDDSTIEFMNESWSQSGGCKDQITQCYESGNASVCSKAQSFCNGNVLGPGSGDWDVYYVLDQDPSIYPPDFGNWLSTVQDTIGAEKDWVMTNYDVYSNFAATGDWMLNSADEVASVVDSGIRTFIFCGDADYILNYPGIENWVELMNSTVQEEYSQQEFANYTVNGTVAGLYKQAKNLSYMRVFGAGHEVPAYTWEDLEHGQAAFQFFSDIMAGTGLVST